MKLLNLKFANSLETKVYRYSIRHNALMVSQISRINHKVTSGLSKGWSEAPPHRTA